MKSWLLQRQLQFDALSLRERLLVSVSCAATLFLFWQFLMFAPQHAHREALNLQMGVLQQKLDFQTQEVTALTGMIGGGKSRIKMQQLAGLKEENQRLNETMSKLEVDLVPADELLNVLKDVLRQSSKLTIRRIESLSPEDLNFTGARVPGDIEKTGVLKHTVLLSLEGNFFGLLRYLTDLEQLSWLLHWDSLSYEVTEYPRGNIELKVSTLTVEESFFGN